MKKIILRAAVSILNKLMNLFLAILITTPLAILAIDEAYKQRGYFAVGGEWLFIVFILAALIMLSEKKGRVKHECRSQKTRK